MIADLKLESNFIEHWVNNLYDWTSWLCKGDITFKNIRNNVPLDLFVLNLLNKT